MSNAFKKRTLGLFLKIKQEKFNETIPKKIPIHDFKGDSVAFLRPITKSALSNSKEIRLLANWRQENNFAFPTQFKVTVEGTKNWLKNQLIKNPTRVLFFVESPLYKNPIGHLGLYSFNFRYNICEIDNVVRGRKDVLKGIMTLSLKALLKWTKEELKPKKIFLRVFSDNRPAIKLYKRCGFVNFKMIPLKKESRADMIIWKESKKLKKPEKYFLKMILRQ